MNWSLLFVIFIMILLLRVVYLRLKANSVKAESFRNLSDRDKMAVLKECLLNTPTRTNLENLAEFDEDVTVVDVQDPSLGLAQLCARERVVPHEVEDIGELTLFPSISDDLPPLPSSSHQTCRPGR